MLQSLSEKTSTSLSKCQINEGARWVNDRIIETVMYLYFVPYDQSN